ncbi:YadA-like family protein [Veillonella sp.]|uniref:YadA C-terminal domain-containing protein n=3 Tax=Veillonellaceae TaxID=31977 RepID=UPI0039A2D877
MVEYSVGTDNKVAMDVVDKTGKTIGAVTITDVAKASDVGNIGKIHQDLQNTDGSKTTVVDAVNNLDNKVGDLKYSAVTKGDIKDGDSSTTAIGKLNQKLSGVAAVAGQHSSVSTTDANIQIQEGTNAAGGKDYALSLNKKQNLTSVVTGDTRMDTHGIKVGDKVTLTKDGLSAGDTKITNDGLSIGDKTYVTKDGLNANGNKVTHVADGKVEKGSKDAVNGGQLYNTNQMVINNVNNISSLGNALGRLAHRVNKVGAGAAALAALHPLDFDPDDKWDFAAGYGNYNGVNAAAIGAYYRPNEDTTFSVGGSFGNGENMVNAGVSVKLGQGNHVSTSKVAMAKEIKELRKEVEAFKSALLDGHAGRKWNTSKLQLFPDVFQNHWAYEQLSILKANGVIAGYPDGKYEGERPMTRYEFATMLFRAMEKGAVLSDRMFTEFAPELECFTVDAVHTDKDGKPTVERVRIAKTERS